MIGQLFSDRNTAAVMGGAVTSGYWMPSVQRLSETFELWLPIVSMTFLVIQIVGYVAYKVVPRIKTMQRKK